MKVTFNQINGWFCVYAVVVVVVIVLRAAAVAVVRTYIFKCFSLP